MAPVEVPAGRSVEAERIARFLAQVDDPSASRVLRLVGDAGIGKTRLWWWVVGEARRRGFMVLTCTPTGRGLAYEGVEDLLAPIAPAQPAPVRGAPAAVVNHYLAMIREVASGAHPVLLAIDDWPFLDSESQRLLQSVPQRLTGQQVLIVVMARRLEGAPTDDWDLGTSAPGPREASELVVVGRLPDVVLEHVLSQRTGGSRPRHVLRQILQVAAGNPMLALELAAAVDRHEAWVDLNGLAGMPQPFRAVADQRLAAMAPPLREVLELVAEAGAITAEALTGLVAGEGDILEQAFDEGLLEVARGRVIPASPLLASHARAGLPPARRRRIHRQLARTAQGIEERAMHLALATPAPDGEVAATLSDASQSAWARGAADAAARFADSALRLTPADDPRRAERLFQAADRWLEAGDLERSRRVAQEGLAEHEETALPATAPSIGASGVAVELLRRVTRASALLEGFRQATVPLRQAVKRLNEDPAPDDADPAAYGELRIRVLVDFTLLLSQYDVLSAWDVAQTLSSTAADVRNGDLLDEAREAYCHVALMACVGDVGLRQLEVDLERAMLTDADPSDVAGDVGGVQRTSSGAGRRSWPLQVEPLPRLIYRELHVARRLRVAGHLEAARQVLARMRRECELEDEEGALTPVLLQASEVECFAGQLDLVDALRSRAADLIARSSQHGSVPHLHYVTALDAALRGRFEKAVVEARAAQRGGAALLDERHVIRGARVLGMVALADRDWSVAHEVLVPAVRSAEDIGYREPGMFRIHADAVEAMCGVGDVEGARALAAVLGARSHLPWAKAAAAYAEGMVLSADGRLDEAAEQTVRAAGEFDALTHPSEAARALVQLASIRRRQRRRGDAGQVLDQAARLLDNHGIALWRTRLESERLLLGHPHEGDDRDLTPAERRTAAAVSRGLTNREIASDLNVSIKTVEAQLTRIYGKLGIHSRSQLVAILLRQRL